MTLRTLSIAGVNEALEKAEKLVKLIAEARTLAGELASSLDGLRFEVWLVHKEGTKHETQAFFQ